VDKNIETLATALYVRIDDLLQAFNRGLLGGQVVLGDHKFVLDESIDGVHVLGTTARPETEVKLIGPDGQEHRLPRSGPVDPQQEATVSLGNVQLKYSWQTPRTMSIDLSNPSVTPAGWVGQWTLTFVDPAGTSPDNPARSSISIWANVKPTWTNQAEVGPLTAETVVPNLRFGLAKTDGAPVDPRQLNGEVSMDVVLVGLPGSGKSVVGKRLAHRHGATYIDLDERITSWNDTAERLYGYRAEEVLGTSNRVIIPPDRQAEEDEIVARVRGAQRPHALACSCRDGCPRAQGRDREVIRSGLSKARCALQGPPCAS